MAEMLQHKELETEDLRLLAFMQRMAQTAQSSAARQVYELFLEGEKKRYSIRGYRGTPHHNSLPHRLVY